MRMPFMLIGLILASGCVPPSFDTGAGMHVFFRPVDEHALQPRVVDSAIEIREESESATIDNAGGSRLGDLDVIAKRTFTDQKLGPYESEDILTGRVSLEVARSGGTHFHPILFETGTGERQPADRLGRGEIQQIHIRYAVYRVDPEGWSKLAPKYRPEHESGKAASAR